MPGREKSERRERQNIPSGVKALPEELLYQVAQHLLRDAWSHKDVVIWLKDHHKLSNATKEWPRACLAYAYQRKLIMIATKDAARLAHALAKGSNLRCRVSVSDDLDTVAEVAADQAVLAIDQVRQADRLMDPPKEKVHIGITAGGTIGNFAAHLAERLEAMDNLPQLVFHALTSGFEPNEPMNTPAVTLGFFSRIRPKPEFSVLLSEPLVPQRAASGMHKRPFLKDAYANAKALDIVVTSLSVAGHPHSMFVKALEQEDPRKAAQRKRDLTRQGWAGDIMWRPYSNTGRLIDLDIEPVSVVRFADLVQMSNDPSKHVICIAGNCAVCSDTKTKALLPYVSSKAQGRRPFSHLVTTSQTARELCEFLDIDLADVP